VSIRANGGSRHSLRSASGAAGLTYEASVDDMTASESSDQARAAAAGDWAICCSGGGIRSAAYCLGALQSLDQRGLVAKARWILGVSGGSYIASSRALVAHYLPGRAQPVRCTGTRADRIRATTSVVLSTLSLSITTTDDEYGCASRYRTVQASVFGSR